MGFICRIKFIKILSHNQDLHLGKYRSQKHKKITINFNVSTMKTLSSD
jgi:hypothetical protein